MQWILKNMYIPTLLQLNKKYANKDFNLILN